MPGNRHPKLTSDLLPQTCSHIGSHIGINVKLSTAMAPTLESALQWASLVVFQMLHACPFLPACLLASFVWGTFHICATPRLPPSFRLHTYAASSVSFPIRLSEAPPPLCISATHNPPLGCSTSKDLLSLPLSTLLLGFTFRPRDTDCTFCHRLWMLNIFGLVFLLNGSKRGITMK